jgi:hypothetical protein
LVIGFIEHLQNASTNNYNSLTELHTAKITVTTAHIETSQFSLIDAWQWLLKAEVPFHLGFQKVPGLIYQLSTDSTTNVKVKVILRPTGSRPLFFGVRHPSGTATNFSPSVFNYLRGGGQLTVSQYVLASSTLVDLRPDITSCRSVAV